MSSTLSEIPSCSSRTRISISASRSARSGLEQITGDSALVCCEGPAVSGDLLCGGYAGTGPLRIRLDCVTAPEYLRSSKGEGGTFNGIQNLVGEPRRSEDGVFPIASSPKDWSLIGLIFWGESECCPLWS